MAFLGLVEPRRAVGGGLVVALPPGVLAPLEDVPVHVVEAERVGCFGGDGAGVARVSVLGLGGVEVPVEPGVVVEVRLVIPEGVFRDGASAAGVLPLRFARQAQPVALEDTLGVDPGEVHDRVLVVDHEGTVIEVSLVLVDLPGGAGERSLSEQEGGDGDGALRSLVGARGPRPRRAHEEVAARDQAEHQPRR